jgi:hypothetical protein
MPLSNAAQVKEDIGNRFLLRMIIVIDSRLECIYCELLKEVPISMPFLLPSAQQVA